MSQLQLLNTTVASLALVVNDVLTQTYRAIYGGADEDELILTTAPLAATSEVQALYTGGLIDFESAMYAHDLPQHPFDKNTHALPCSLHTGPPRSTRSAARPRRSRPRSIASARRRRRRPP